MHSIAQRAIDGESILTLVEEFYGPRGPLAEAGWDLRESQREMSMRFAAQIDADLGADDDEEDGSIGLIEAPCGVGKGGAYLVPGFLAALRAEKVWVRRMERERSRDEYPSHREIVPTAKTHPAKLVVSTANIALQGQLIRKDIPALGRMLGVQPRATLMKSRQNYVCREELVRASSNMYGAVDRGVQDIMNWTQQPGCDGDRESYPGDATEVWHKVSRGSEDCGRQSCPHYDLTGGSLPCYWRSATVDWPRSHIIVGNHHWVALTQGIKVIAYAVDEAHELEAALRGVQGRTLSTSKFVTVAKRASKVLHPDSGRRDQKYRDDVDQKRELVEKRLVSVAELLFQRLERFIESKIPDCSETSMDYKTPVPLRPGWAGEEFTRRLGKAFSDVLNLRDKVIVAATGLPFNTFRAGEVQTWTEERTEEAKTSRYAATTANQMINLCEIMAAVCCGRPHPDWPSNTSPWAIWAHREKDPRDQWRVLVELVPADVAPSFAGLQARFPTMLLASATLPEFSSMRLSLGMGARWVGQPVDPWPSAFRTDTGLFAGRCEIVTPAGDDPEHQDDEPTSNRLATPTTLAPTPKYERRLPSPYPLESMGVLIVPHGPAPGDVAAWQSWTTQKVVAAVRQSGGGALILATSNAAMRRYTEALRAENRWTVIRQGDSGRGKVIQAFKDEEDSVLVGTRSLFQGLDVQGRSCRLVVIDRIPFAPKEPLEEAVGHLLVERALAMNPSARGATPYLLRTAPEAAMVLVQGIGRLIRSFSDRGAVVLLDNRILQPGSGFALLRDALPPFPLSNRLEDIGRILSGSPLSGAVQRRSTSVQADMAF